MIRLKTLHRRLRNTYHGLKAMRRLESESSVTTDAAMLCRGFLSERRGLYSFNEYHKDWFITDWEIETRFAGVNGKLPKEILTNKPLFKLWLRASGMASLSPALIGIQSQGIFHTQSGYRTIDEALEDNTHLFLKPIAGHGGKGCRIVREQSDIPKTGSYLIEEMVIPHGYARKIAPWSINTIRVFTMRDEDDTFFLAGAAHRFGGDRGRPVDNFGSGGIACLVDIESGQLSAGKSLPGLQENISHEWHPFTGVRFQGVEVPYWKETKSLAMQLSRIIPGLNYAGWDISISEDGPKVIEGNGMTPNPDMVQVHRPLLLDARVLEFFCRHNALSRRHADRLWALHKAHKSGPQTQTV